MCVTDRHDMTLAVKLVLNPNTTNLLRRITPLEPAGSIMSTGLDMLKWMTFILENATTSNGSNLLDLDLFEQAFQVGFRYDMHSEIRGVNASP